jgi:putative transposase
MSASTRVEFPGALYHVMGHAIEPLSVFSDEESCRHFLHLTELRVESGDLVVHAFCLMPSHYHLLLETPRGGLSRWMRDIAGTFAQVYNRRHERRGHVWQGRYKAILVGDGPYLAECSRYIHWNPARALLALPPETWKWSSYRNYLRCGKPAVAWVETRRVLETLGFGGETPAQAARLYRAYVESSKDRIDASPFQRAAAGLVLGGEAFLSRVRDLVKGRPANEDQPSLSRLRREVRAGETAVIESIRKEFPDLGNVRTLRRFMIYGLVAWAGWRKAAAARRFGLSRAAATFAVRDVERRTKEDPETARRWVRLGRSLAGARIVTDLTV